MTTASDAMPRYAPERIDEVFTPLPQRLQHWADTQGDTHALHDESGMLTWSQQVDNSPQVPNQPIELSLHHI